MKSNIRTLKNWLWVSKKHSNFANSLKISRVTMTDLKDEKLMKELFDTYRDVFGHGGATEWGEYAKCMECEKSYDIEEVHGLVEYVYISNLPPLPKSKCCNAPLEYFHDDESLRIKFSRLVKKEHLIISILKDTNPDRMVGFIFGFIGSASVAWHENIKDKLVLPKESNYDKCFSEEQISFIDAIGIIKSYRRGIIPVLLLLDSFMKMAGKVGNTKNILFYTSKNSKLFNLIHQLPFKIILEDLRMPTQLVITMPFMKTFQKVRFLGIVYI